LAVLAQRHGAPCVLDGQGCASDYAEQLLTTLGAHVQRSFLKTDISADRAWAQSGAMALTGRSDGPPQPCPAPLAACVEGVRVALRTLAGQPVDLPDAATLGERAALSGLTRNGSISPGGACRLLPAADGWLAVNLPRPDDWSLLAAWLETLPLANGNWEGLASALSLHTWENLCERGTLLGLAVAALQPANNTADAPATTARPWFQIVAQGPPRLLNRHTPPLVIDLSALWAGPFCAHLLQQLGMRVIKVESRQRPDGARHGPTAFYDLLNQGKASVTFDFSVAADLHRLRALLRRADIVIESSRPRGLRQLGIHAEELVATTPGLTWLAISGYGRDAAHENRIAYGDDAGVSGGLSALLFKQTGEPMFCGDAIADPLTGWHAALAALASQQSGGGRLISLALSDVVAHCAQHPQSDGHSIIATEQIAPPRARRAQAPARALGADTVEILSELGIAC
jgi:crotonobetainyl-CoA:carnitine CoA-transferase CaiB-like acyl-CoA transferase